ncbi:MAG TPA: HEAT repeat domain-containing protein [Candidatus Manganitrophaceae bacterium]|nr:HEAT repeat domain-containing protein [Candidatus Manganitrophaceae bacterium]
MPITMKEVRAWLDPEEVDYPKAKKMGAAALPFLMELAQGGDLGLASKATYLASLIKSKKSAEVLEAAVARNEPVLKAAAASGIRNLPGAQAERLFDLLKNDSDAGIRKVTVQSAFRVKSPRVAAKLQQVAENDPEPFVRELAASSIKKIKSKKQTPLKR